MHDACCVYLVLDMFTIMSGVSYKARVFTVDNILLQLYIAFHCVINFLPSYLVRHIT